MRLGDLRHPDPVIQRIIDYLRGQAAAEGAGTLTWPGGNRLTNVLTVQHGLGVVPKRITLGSSSPNMHVAYSNVTAQGFDVTGNTIDGTSPAAATARGFSWRASR